MQDTPPYFLVAPPVTRLNQTAKAGDFVTQVVAFDGDYAHPRRIRYGLDPAVSPGLSSYFGIDQDTGVISIRKNIQVCTNATMGTKE